MPIILGSIALFLFLVCALGSYGGWVYYKQITGKVPGHQGFGYGELGIQVENGWVAQKYPELGMTLETPTYFIPYYRTILQHKYPWVTSYESFHGRVSKASYIVGALWMDPSSPHFSGERSARNVISMLEANSVYQGVHGDVGKGTVAGKEVSTLYVTYDYSGVPYREKAIHFTTRDAVVYIITTYKEANAAKADQDWHHLLESIKFTH